MNPTFRSGEQASGTMLAQSLASPDTQRRRLPLMESRPPFPIIAIGRKKYLDLENPRGSEERAQEVIRGAARYMNECDISMTLAIPGYELDALALGIEHPAAASSQPRQRKLLEVLRDSPITFARTTYSEDCGVCAADLLKEQYLFGELAAARTGLPLTSVATVPRSAVHRLAGMLSYLKHGQQVSAIAMQRPRVNPVLAPNFRLIPREQQYVVLQSQETSLPALVRDAAISDAWEAHMSGRISAAVAVSTISQRAQYLASVGQPFGVLFYEADRVGKTENALPNMRNFLQLLAERGFFKLRGYSADLLDECALENSANAAGGANALRLDGSKPRLLHPREDKPATLASKDHFRNYSGYHQTIALVLRDRGFSKANALELRAEDPNNPWGLTTEDCKTQQTVAERLSEALSKQVYIPAVTSQYKTDSPAVRRQLFGIHAIAKQYS